MDLRPLTKADITHWGKFIGICFNQSPSDMEHLIHWLTCLGRVDAYGLWDNDLLVAQYASLLRTICCYDNLISVGMSINMAVHPDYRGMGLIKQVSQPVYENLRDKYITIGLGFSNAQGVKVDQHSQGYGYQVVGQMQPLIIRLKTFQKPPLFLSDNLPEHHLNINNQPQKAHFHKDLTYLIKRYVKHPFRQYHYAIWQENDELLGVIVYKKVRLWGTPSVALLDVYSDDIEELLMRWSTTLRQNNLFICHTLVTPHSVLKEALQQHWHVVYVPYSRTPYYLTVKPLSNQIKPSLFEFCEWDLIGGDV